MKMSFGQKLVLFLHWLASLVIAALAVMFCFWPDLVHQGFEIADQFAKGYADIIAFVLLGIYALLAVLSIVFIFSDKKKRSDRGFITVDSSEAGRTRIAIGAVDQMIRQAVRSVDGIVDMKSSIVNCEDAVSINTNVTIVSGAHVPTVTMNMQRAVRSYIELNCGVAVREVCVNVNALETSEDGKHGRRKASGVVPAAAAPVIQQPVADHPVKQVEEADAEPSVEPVAEEIPAVEAEEPAGTAEVSE